MKTLRTLLAFLVLGNLALAAESVKKVTPAEAAKLVAEGKAVLVDIREPSEWAASGVAKPAFLLPMSDFNGEQKLWKPFLEQHAGTDLILYCRSGNRVGLLGPKLVGKGLHVANAGGFKDWVAAGLPVAQP